MNKYIYIIYTYIYTWYTCIYTYIHVWHIHIHTYLSNIIRIYASRPHAHGLVEVAPLVRSLPLNALHSCVSMYTCIHTFISTYIFKYVYILYIRKYTYFLPSSCGRFHMFIHVCVSQHIYLYMYVCMHTYIYMCIAPLVRLLPRDAFHV